MNKLEVFELCKEYMLDRNNLGYYGDNSKCIELFNKIKGIVKSEDDKIVVISMFYNMFENDEIETIELNDLDLDYNRNDFINRYMNEYEYNLELSNELLKEDLSKFNNDLFGFDING